MNQRLNQEALLEGVGVLAQRDEDLARIVAMYGPPPLWNREPGFPALVQIILEQQVSLASARTAFNRLELAVQPMEPEKFLTLTDEELKKIGFSRQKTRYVRELAKAILAGSLDLPGLENLDDEEAKAQLMSIKGIGFWTADIYLLMALGRPDIWPHGDLALEAAIQRIKGWEQRPTQEEVRQMTTAWRPWRAVAARLFWHFYLSEPK